MMLEDGNIKLRAPEPEDLDVFYEWENDTVLWPVGCTLIPYSRYDLKQYISSSKDLYETKQLRLVIEKKPEKEAIGTIDLYDFDPYHRRAAVGIMIDRNQQKKGLASEALALFCNYAFSFLKIHQLYACIPVDNEPSRRLFARCGFHEKCTLSDWQLTHEGYKDVLLVSLISGF
jgi:diamine N-acetyltransferase